jgi:signal transduction histidine kinase/DNA-binding NarL/FixJ family response regulator
VLEVRTKVLDTGLAVRTFTDITEQERIADVLAEARDAAEAAARARSDFLAVMSHEIRTPLNGVIGVAGLLEGMELGPEQRDYVRLIRQSGDHLLDLINDILDFSRLDAQRVELEAVEFDPRALMQGVVALFLAQARSKGLRLSASSAETVPAVLTGDPGRLRQILLNLVGNAVKFTDRGWVTVAMTHEMRDDGRLRLMVNVADSGIGIASGAIEHMFDEFTQMDGSISRRFGGSGLGLAICRRLVELMDGSIAVESQPGVGSSFHFDVSLNLAAAAAPPETVTPATPAPTKPLHILLAEDNPTNRLVALRLLERLGHQADAAGNGAEAIALLARTHYDVVLMDVMMPEMDGLTATRHIRTTEPPGARIAIVGLTAGSGADSLAACIEAGMDAVTTKPVTLARLRAAIAEGTGSATSRLTAPSVEITTSRLSELADILGHEAVAEIVQTFAEDTRTNLAAMHQAAEQGDGSLIHRAVHSVAGAARNVGADALAIRASALENGLGALSPVQIAAEVEAMQRDLDAALHRLGVDDGGAGDAIAGRHQVVSDSV